MAIFDALFPEVKVVLLKSYSMNSATLIKLADIYMVIIPLN